MTRTLTDPGTARPVAASPVIVAQGLNFAFGQGALRKQVLFDVNFEVATGEIVLLTGPSGCGKTTLLTLVGALRQVVEGELTVLSRQLHHAQDEVQVAVRREIGFIFQHHNLLPFLTARKNVELMFRLHPDVTGDEAHQRTEKILALVGLEDRIDYLPSRLSGGQKQRVAIARALVAKPRLILADEPTAALDRQSGRDAVDLLRDLARRQGSPILMVTHDNRILDIADRIVEMDDGRIVKA